MIFDERRAALEALIAEADELQLASVIDALEAALVARVHPRVAALMRASVHGIRLTCASSKRHEARALEQKGARHGTD